MGRVCQELSFSWAEFVNLLWPKCHGIVKKQGQSGKQQIKQTILGLLLCYVHNQMTDHIKPTSCHIAWFHLLLPFFAGCWTLRMRMAVNQKRK